LTGEEKKAVNKELLFSSDEEDDKEERRRKADNLARARRKRDAMLWDMLLSDSSIDDREE
jgi:hypothetical protein